MEMARGEASFARSAAPGGNEGEFWAKKTTALPLGSPADVFDFFKELLHLTAT